jgi:zinc transport system permease protein
MIEILEILKFGFVQNAIIGAILVSIATSLIGFFLVQKKLSLLGDGLSHASFGGIAIGLLTGLNPLITAMAVAILGALGIEKFIEKIKSHGDAAIAIVLSSGMALAITIISAVNGFNVNIFSYLFGSILSLSDFDLFLLVLSSIIVILTILFIHKQIILVILNPDLARLNGVNNKLVNYLLAIVSAITVVIAIRAVGILLVTGLLVIPTLTALINAKSFKSAIITSIIISVFSSLIGIFLAFYFDLAPSGVIILTMVFIFILKNIYVKFVK